MVLCLYNPQRVTTLNKRSFLKTPSRKSFTNYIYLSTSMEGGKQVKPDFYTNQPQVRQGCSICRIEWQIHKCSVIQQTISSLILFSSWHTNSQVEFSIVPWKCQKKCKRWFWEKRNRHFQGTANFRYLEASNGHTEARIGKFGQILSRIQVYFIFFIAFGCKRAKSSLSRNSKLRVLWGN